MIKINLSILPFIKATGNRVALRVRWSSKTTKRAEVDFITGAYAEKEKWDADARRAKKGTNHHVRDMKFTASEINDRIATFQQEIEDCMATCSMKNTVPTPQELKDMVNKSLRRGKSKVVAKPKTVKKKNLEKLLDDFLADNTREKNWDDQCQEKYVQAYHHLTGSNPGIQYASEITLDTMYQLREWYINNGYKNRTINKQTAMLKCFLRWINNQAGYSIPNPVLDFATNLKVMKHTVTFLHYEELTHFASYQFKPNEERLTRARDFWCFMAFTSLRFSDLRNLKTGHIHDNHIEMMTQKTSDRIIIPLTDGAISILNRYKGKETADGRVFNVPSNQKLNDAIKDAARAAGLDRTIVETYTIGRERKEEQHKFYEIISCHDARRTFVSWYNRPQ